MKQYNFAFATNLSGWILHRILCTKEGDGCQLHDVCLIHTLWYCRYWWFSTCAYRSWQELMRSTGNERLIKSMCIRPEFIA